MGCITPFQKTDVKLGLFISVPCGKCPQCLKRRASGWSFRLMQQDKISYMAKFVTLTLAPDHIELTRNGFMTLDKLQLQRFFKRLRKIYQNEQKNYDYVLPPIKYYAVGEYGGKYLRPHYHIIIFNASDTAINAAWREANKTQYKEITVHKKGHKPYKKIVQSGPVTDMGNIVFGDVSGASVGYTLKYMSKPSIIPLHVNDDRLKEFSLMSKGLGANYITPAMIEWHQKDLLNRMHHVIEDGKIIAMPRYYKDKIYTEQERKKIAWNAIEENITRELEKEQELIRKFGQNDYLRVVVERDAQSFKKMFKNATRNRDRFESRTDPKTS